MDVKLYEEYLQRNNISTIPSSYWEPDYPKSYTLIKPFDRSIFNIDYPTNIVDCKKTFNITFLFQKESYYNTNDILSLIKFILKSNLSSKYNVIFKFNYEPHPHIVKTIPLAKIKYISKLPTHEYFGLLQNSHLICSIHRTAFSGRFLAEAAMFRVPIISSPVGGAMQFLDDSNALFFKSKNADGPENFVPCEECYGGIFNTVEQNYNNMIRFAYRCHAIVSRLYSQSNYNETLKYIREETES